MDRLQEYYKNALLANLCGEWKGYWQAASHDKEKLVRLAMAQQSLPHMMTFANEGKGLTKEYILDTFGEYINGKYVGIDVDGVAGGYRTELYVGYNGVLELSDDVLAMMWCVVPSLSLKPAKATKIYVSNSSEVHLVCEGYNNATVMLFDDSTVWLDDIDPESNVTIYRYSPKARVEIGDYCLSGKVRQFDKLLRL